VLAWLFVWSEVQTCIWPSWCHGHSPSLTSVKSRLVLPFWYRLTRVVPEKGTFKRVCVCNCQMTITQQHGGIVKFQLYFWLQFQNWYETVPALCQREKPSMTFSCVTGSQSYTDYTPGMCLAPVLNNIKNVFIVWETFLLVDKKRYFISNLRITFHCQSTYTSKWIT